MKTTNEEKKEQQTQPLNLPNDFLSNRKKVHTLTPEEEKWAKSLEDSTNNTKEDEKE